MEQTSIEIEGALMDAAMWTRYLDFAENGRPTLLIVKPDHSYKSWTFDGARQQPFQPFDEARKEVGSYLAPVPKSFTQNASTGGVDLVVYCDEDGRMKGLEVNRMATLLAGLMTEDGTCLDILCGKVAFLLGFEEETA